MRFISFSVTYGNVFKTQLLFRFRDRKSIKTGELHHMEAADDSVNFLIPQCHLHFFYNIDDSAMGAAVE